MKFRAHRGHNACPENTIPAIRRALMEGFEMIETDPTYTKDGEIILMHDPSINRTCRNSDGTPIAQRIDPAEVTYRELLKYDAGIAFGEEFRGTPIPRLEEALALLDGTGVVLSLDKKIKTEEMDSLFDLVEKYNVTVEFSCRDTERIRRVLARLPHAWINYDGNTTEEELRAVTSLVPYDQLIVWMYYDNPNFAWLTDRMKASPENCARVKRYARLGIANVITPYEVRDAMRFGADVIEPL